MVSCGDAVAFANTIIKVLDDSKLYDLLSKNGRESVCNNLSPQAMAQNLVGIYSHYDYNDFVLCLGYKSWKFKEYFLNYHLATSDISIDLTNPSKVEFGNDGVPPWKITLAETGLESMTGCRIKRIQKYIGNETFMLTCGDGVSDINIKKLVDFHRSHGKLATVISVRPASRFGELVVKGDQVTDFQEKVQTSAGLINGGFSLECVLLLRNYYE